MIRLSSFVCLLGVLAGLCLTAPTATAQPASPAARQWVTLNVGTYHVAPSAHTTKGVFSGGVQVQVQRRHAYQGGLNAHGILDDYGLLAFHLGMGQLWGYRSLFVSAFTGPALLYGTQRTAKNPKAPLQPYGLVLNVQATWELLPELGLGLEGFGVLSPDRLAVAPRLSLVLGPLR